MGMGAKKPRTLRRVWRVTSEAPAGEIVDFDPTDPAGRQDPPPAKVLDPAPVVDWRGSSFDLLNGLEVRDHTDSIPGELFDKLFKRR
jgi:hypothetical protein